MTKILAIEDENAILENILEILEMEGFEVITAHNGEQGIHLAHQTRPDLIVCDIMMPGIDGYGVLLELRSEISTSQIPFIFLTAKAERAAMRYGMELGADDYITKPFSPAELITAIHARLQKQADRTWQYEKKLAELRGSIFHMLPHELRTPLVSIMGYAELLILDGENLPGERIVEMGRTMLRSSQRLHHLIENFLLHAQIEIFSADPERLADLRAYRTCDPIELISDVAIRKTRDSQREKDLQLELDPVDALQVLEDNLKKIVEELVDNACKFSSSGTPIWVSGGIDNGTGYYTVAIHNLGRGMTPEQVADVGAGVQFQRRLYEQQGTGMGLILSKRLAELHEGSLFIDSEPGQDITVRVTLPVGRGR